MSIPPETVKPGKCYLARSTRGLRVRRVTILTREGEVRYEARDAATARALGWIEAGLPLSDFAFQAEREVPCNWTPEI